MEESETDDGAAVRERPEGGDYGSSELQAAVVTHDSQHSEEPEDVRVARHTGTASLDAPVSAAFARRNPFDPRVSLKDPFPKFEDSMAGFRLPDADDENDEANDDDENSSVLLNNSSSSPATGVNLDWSIDTIAELKPMAFSPLSEQKNSSTGALDDTLSSTAANTSFHRFFEDEAQYKVLRTPSPLIRQQEQQQQTQSLPHLAQVQERHRPPQPHSSASPGPPPRAPTPPSSIPSHTFSSAQKRLSLTSVSTDLHRRCQNAIAFCEDRLRERERKLSRLQLPQPSSSSPPGALKIQQNRNKRFRAPYERDSEFPWKTPNQQQQQPLRSSELKGIHPRSTPLSSKPGSGSGLLGLNPMQSSPFSVPFTPIASARGLQTPAKKKNPRVDPEFSFDGGSPISPIAPFSGHREREEEEKEGGPGAETKGSSFVTSPSFSDGEERDKENRGAAAQQKPRAIHPGTTTSSDSPSFTLSTSSSWSKAVEDSFSLQTLARLHGDQSASSLSSISASTPGPLGISESQPRSHDPRSHLLASPSIAQRQESFMAAIEAEAKTRSPSQSASPEPQQPQAIDNSSAHKSSIAELFQEARARGIEEPRAQHEYVQLLKQQRGRQHL